MSYLLELGAKLLSGPATALSASLTVFTLIYRGKLPPRWLALIGGIGGVYSFSVLRGGLAHDLGHVVLNECASPYGTLTFVLGGGSAVCLAAATAIQRSIQSLDLTKPAPK